MKISIKQILTSLFSVTFFVFQANAEIKLPAIFGDNMVLQQQSDVAVWGWAKANTSVKVGRSMGLLRTIKHGVEGNLPLSSFRTDSW